MHTTPHTEATKQKIREALKTAFTDEVRMKMRLAKLGKKNGPHTTEAKRKISLAAKGKPKSDAHRKALSDAKRKQYADGLLVSPFKRFWSENPTWRSGEHNNKWIADRSKLAKRQERNDSAYKEWRKSVRDRDGWRCKMANGDCLGKVVAHHILPWSKFPELRYEVNNGITLCRFHHPRKRVDEMKLSPYFQSLVMIKSN